MRAMATAPPAVLIESEAVGIVAAIFCRRVVAPLALIARQVDNDAILLRCLGHVTSSDECLVLSDEIAPSTQH